MINVLIQKMKAPAPRANAVPIYQIPGASVDIQKNGTEGEKGMAMEMTKPAILSV